jgi:hypothetical protein
VPVAAGDNRERRKSEAAWARLCEVSPLEASSGKIVRHRLNPGGNRRANADLCHIVITRMSGDPRTKAYVERRTKEGRTAKEIILVLKRYVAREVYPYISSPACARSSTILTKVVHARHDLAHKSSRRASNH